MFYRLSYILAGASISFLFGSSAHAIALAPGGFSTPLPGSSVALEPQLAGPIVEDVVRTVEGTFTSSGNPFKVEIEDRVVHSVDGTYDFYYRITLITKPDVYPLVVSRDGFSGFTTNVGWRTDGLGAVEPADAFRTADGDVVSFSWGFGDVPQGSQTRFFYVDTDATAYAEIATGRIDLSPSFSENGYATFSTFAPAVPEPETYAMLLTGLGLFGFVARRRKG